MRASAGESAGLLPVTPCEIIARDAIRVMSHQSSLCAALWLIARAFDLPHGWYGRGARPPKGATNIVPWWERW